MLTPLSALIYIQLPKQLKDCNLAPIRILELKNYYKKHVIIIVIMKLFLFVL